MSPATCLLNRRVVQRGVQAPGLRHSTATEWTRRPQRQGRHAPAQGRGQQRPRVLVNAGEHDPSWQPEEEASRLSREWQAYMDRQSSALPSSWRQPVASNVSYNSWDFAEEELMVPAPSNLPVNELFADASAHAALLRPLELWKLTDQPGIDLFLAGPQAWGHLKEVFVILFGVGMKDSQEGIYSLRASSPDGMPQETIIGFESEEDAERYAGLLEATMEHVPNVCSIPPKELLEFCMDQGYQCRLEPNGSLLIPPDCNVNMTDWERSNSLKEGRWSVLAAEPAATSSTEDCSTSSSGASSAISASACPWTPPALPASAEGTIPDALPWLRRIGPPSLQQPGQPGQPQPAPAAQQQPLGQPQANAAPMAFMARYSELTESELAMLRARLETLLPKD